MTSGVTLREERLAAGIQQRDVADEMGVVHSALVQLEQRERVRETTAVRYREALTRCIEQRKGRSRATLGQLLVNIGEQLIAAGADV